VTSSFSCQLQVLLRDRKPMVVLTIDISDQDKSRVHTQTSKTVSRHIKPIHLLNVPTTRWTRNLGTFFRFRPPLLINYQQVIGMTGVMLTAANPVWYPNRAFTEKGDNCEIWVEPLPRRETTSGVSPSLPNRLNRSNEGMFIAIITRL